MLIASETALSVVLLRFFFWKLFFFVKAIFVFKFRLSERWCHLLNGFIRYFASVCSPLKLDVAVVVWIVFSAQTNRSIWNWQSKCAIVVGLHDRERTRRRSFFFAVLHRHSTSTSSTWSLCSPTNQAHSTRSFESFAGARVLKAF